MTAAAQAGLPVLAWTLPATVASQLREEPASRSPASHQTASTCASASTAPPSAEPRSGTPASSPTPVLWRRLQILGDCEHLRWLRRPLATGRF